MGEMTQRHGKIENHLDTNEAKWFAVYTKYKREKIVEKELRIKGVEVYLPIQKLTRQWTRKVRVVELPLISCYIFVKITRKEYVRVLETQDVLNFVKFSKNLIAIPDREVEIMKRVVGEGLEIEVDPLKLVPGDKVEVVKGNLMGLKGKLVECGSKNFLVELNNIGYSLRMQINADLIRKVEAVY